MSAIGPGDWVVCVDNRPRTFSGTEARLRLHALYRVERVTHYFGYPGLVLDGVRSAGFDGAFHADRFRPIDRRTTELFRSWLTDLPADLDARPVVPAREGTRVGAEVHPAFREEQSRQLRDIGERF